MFTTNFKMILATIYGLSKDSRISFLISYWLINSVRCWNIIHVYTFYFDKMKWKFNCQVEIENNELLWNNIKMLGFDAKKKLKV
jgi:hypothetical protein